MEISLEHFENPQHNKDDLKLNENDEKHLNFPTINTDNKNYYLDKNFPKKNLSNEILENENEILDNENEITHKYSNEIEVIVNNNHKKDYNYNNQKHIANSFKRYDNYDYNYREGSNSLIENQKNNYNYNNYFNSQQSNYQNPHSNNHIQSHSNPNSNFPISHHSNYKNSNSSYFRNSVKNKIKNNSQNNNNPPINNSIINNNNPIYSNSTTNPTNQNYNSTFGTQVTNLLFKKKKLNYNKLKSKKISKQNHFVLTYEKTNDFSNYKSIFNLNLKFLKQNYKIRDLNMNDYEIENLKTEKSKKSKKKNSLNPEMENNQNFIMMNFNNQNMLNQMHMNNLNKLYPNQNYLQNYNNINNNNNFNNDKENIKKNIQENKKNCLSSSEEIPNLQFINPYYFNNQNMNNFNMQVNNNNNQDLNGNILDNINYLSDDNINDIVNNTNNHNFNLPSDNPLNNIGFSNQNNNNNNYYDNLKLQPYTFINDPKLIEENMVSGRYLTGVIRINKCHTHGYITVAGLFNDILIRGNRNLNQSLHLDEVVVELFPMVCWKPLFNKKIRKISYNVNDESKKYVNIPHNNFHENKMNLKKHNNFNSNSNQNSPNINNKIHKKSITKNIKEKKEEKNLKSSNLDLYKNDYKETNNISEENSQNKRKNNYENEINDNYNDSESDTEENLESDSGDSLNGNNYNNFNYFTDADKDLEDYQQGFNNDNKKNVRNIENEINNFYGNYGNENIDFQKFNIENNTDFKFKENFKTLEERLVYINKLCNLRPEGRIVKLVNSPNMEKNQIVKIINDKSLIFACPIDENIPRIFIKMKKFRRMEFLRKLENDNIFKNKYFLVKIVGWALNFKCPKGIIINELGNSGDIEVETEVLLRTYEVDYPADYPQKIQEDINQFENWKIPEETIKKRHDLRNELIFTVDPKHSKDLDDAISCKLIDEERGLLEIGVHIADPSYFIPKDSLIDKEALNRTTTVYLVHKNIPMLPRLLSDNVISLLPFKDRLAFSCSFRIFFDGALDLSFTPIFYLSVINSAVKWNYELVQKIINDEDLKYTDLSDENQTKPQSPETFKKLCESVKMLHKLTKLVRSQRIESGSLIIENEEIAFDLNEDLKPINFYLKKKLDSHYLIEELMLIANKLSAEYIYDNIKDLALVRKHPLLNDNKFQEIQRYLTNNKMVVDFEDPQALNEMLFKMEAKDKNKYICVQKKLKNFMQRAEYTLTKDKDITELRHSALNFDLYTHFTSPIRRYPDLVVHRQIKYILNKLNKLNYENKNDNKNHEENILTLNENNETIIIENNKNYNFEKDSFDNSPVLIITDKMTENNLINIADIKINTTDNTKNLNSEIFLDNLFKNVIDNINKENHSIENKENNINDSDLIFNKNENNIITVKEKNKILFDPNYNEFDYETIINYEKFIDHFNEKYYNGKQISTKCQKLFQCIFLKNIPNQVHKALIVDISNKVPNKNKRLPQQQNSFDTQTLVISIFIPTLNLELDWKKEDNNNIINFKFNTDTSVSIDYKDEEDQNVHNKIFKTFEEINVIIIPIDTIPIDIKCTILFSLLN